MSVALFSSGRPVVLRITNSKLSASVASLLSSSRYRRRWIETILDLYDQKRRESHFFYDTEALCFAARFISIANSGDQLTSKLDRCTAYRTCVHISSPAWDLSKSKGRWNISVCQEPQTKTRSCSLRVEAHPCLPPS